MVTIAKAGAAGAAGAGALELPAGSLALALEERR